MRSIGVAAAFLVAAVLWAPPGFASGAAPHCGQGQTAEFVLGFADLKSHLGDAMGDPLECEHANPENGDALQATTTGLSFYRQSTNTPTFTDGWNHWALTAAGLIYWTGDSIDPPGITPPPPPPPAKDEQVENFWGFPCTVESDPNPLFSHPVTEFDLIATIVPSGSQAGNVIKQHSFISLNRADPRVSDPPGAPIYAPAASRLISIGFYAEAGVGQYLLFFEVSCEVMYKFDHLSAVVDSIRSVSPPEPKPDSRTDFLREPIEFAAGELIGWTTGAPPEGPFDWGVYNTTHRNSFANQTRYDAQGMEQALHADCPYDYFDEAMRAAHLGKSGTPGGRQVSVAECPSTSRDVPGTVAGAWFDEATGVEGFAIAADLSGQVRLGGPGYNLVTDMGTATWADPGTVTSEHCYENWPNGGDTHVFLKLLSPDRLAVARGAGACPSKMPEEFQVYVR